MNNVSLVGRLTKDPEIKDVGGTKLCQFTLAVDKGLSKAKKQEFENKGKPTADFLRIQVWGRQGESSHKFLAKGRLVSVSGSISTSSDNDGNFYTNINAFNVGFLEWGDDNDSSDKKSNYNKSDNKTQSKSGEGMNDDFNIDDFDDDDDIPF